SRSSASPLPSAMLCFVVFALLLAWGDDVTDRAWPPPDSCVFVAPCCLPSGLAGCHVLQAQLMHSCLAAVKASMLVVQRSQDLISAALQAGNPDCTLQPTLSGLLDCYTHILTDEEFVQAVQSTAGMAVVLLIRSVLGCGDEVASLGAECAPLWLRESCVGLYDSGRPAGVSLYLCHGALAMLNWRGASQGPRRDQLLLLVPHTLLALDTSIKESSTAMVVARVLSLWSGVALDSMQSGQSSAPGLLRDSLRGGSELQGRLLEHVYTHWEHPLDGVRHQTNTLFKNLLLLHQHTHPLALSNPHSDPYVSQLTQTLLGLEWHQRGKYGSLACLVELLGAGYLLALEPQLPSHLLGLMGDQTLAPYASDLLERLFVSHKAQLAGEGDMERWHGTWVSPLLQVLCRARLDQTTYILDYFLPKLLRCSPSSLAHMVQALQNSPSCSAGTHSSRGSVGALMTCLRAARAQGMVQSSEEGLWGGLVPLSLLRQALVHKHHQVRMDALGLVCESHRSTEVLTSQEIELLCHFLPSCLNSQSPGVRQHFYLFLSSFPSVHLFLPPFSFSHPLCLSFSLRSLSGPEDMFALGEVVTPVHAQNVLFCLGSNFLEVKQLASALLRQLPPSAVGLQEPDRMLCLLQAAMDLSTSTKPFDSVTAAHLFNLLLHLPDLPQALLLCAQEQGLSFQPPSLTQPQASEALTLETNTLAVIQFLLLCLKTEVRKAESSLLLAAATSPLYGRAHCITAALQQLNTRCLTLCGQWRSVVSELITVSYRMSDVVSPVVQSSSPEGLIPMDTETGQNLLGSDSDIVNILTTHMFHHYTLGLTLQGVSVLCLSCVFVCLSLSLCLCVLGGGGEGYRVTAQMVLVCCWRTMKEVSMLLGEVCQSLPLQTTHTPPDQALITEEQVEGVGRYFRQQLLQSRHRGAFELAYIGFVRLNDMLCRSGSRTLQQLPAHWLTEVLQEVKSSDPSSKLCATRRSAGIPFYIQALLSSEPKSSSCSLLKTTMRELTTLAMPPPDRATDETTVPQVHALNILRALYRDTRLGENIVPFVSEGMQAAVLGFTSPVWAVRNSSTLLFSTLITRIFGVKKGKDEHSKKNRMTGREFFTRFPALYPFLLSQLEEAASSVGSGRVILHPSLFLLLLVLGRLFPSPMDGSSSPLGLAPFLPFIIRCGHSAVYRTREMAARALVPFVMVTQVPSTIQALLDDLPLEPAPRTQQNRIHGTLLQVKNPGQINCAKSFLKYHQCFSNQGAAAVALLGCWGALVSQCCGEQQNTEVKMMAAEILVNVSATLLTSPNPPLGVSHTVSLWRGLFTLLQDEDPDVRDRAADYVSSLPKHLLNTDAPLVSVCPPVALEMGVALLCQLFQLWGQVPTGILTLTERILGNDEDDFLFEKGDLNLWAEPVQWVRLLHRHLVVLAEDPGLKVLNQAELLRLSAQAEALSQATQQALEGLPALPQFCCTVEHARLALKQERATLVINILQTLRQAGLSG
uniref:tRNA (32-2'-O)-methyltransferase regulator THADA n=1 Tax=Esox lucius TaxID=8010 RepID=A0AAY5KM06_ESOLU